MAVRGFARFLISGVLLDEVGLGLSGLEFCLRRGFFFTDPERTFLGLWSVPGALSVLTLKDSECGRKPPTVDPSNRPVVSSSPPWRLSERVRV